MRLFLILIFSACSFQLHAQASAEYLRLTKLADSLLEVKNYKEAAVMYSSAFAANKDMAAVKHRYFAACALAESGETDSAFVQLQRIAIKGKYYNYPQISQEAHFKTLYSDKRWAPLLTIIEKNMLEEQERLNKNKPQ
jgi:hypothetical protein